MPNRKCFVPNCISGYASCKEKISLFAVTESRLKTWLNAIPRKDRILSTKDVICEKHFKPEFIIREWKAPNSTVTIPLKKSKLSDDAIPTIFPNCPQYLSKNLKRRKPPKTRYLRETKPAKLSKIKPCRNVDQEVLIQTLPGTNYLQTTDLQTNISPADITLPSKNWTASKIDVNNSEMIVFLELVYSDYLNTCVICKKMTVLNNALEFYYGDKKIIYEEFAFDNGSVDCDLIINILRKFSELKVCSAGPSVNEYKDLVISTGSRDFITSTWRHNKCAAVLKSNENCIYCVKLNDTLRIAFSRKLKKKAVITCFC